MTRSIQELFDTAYHLLQELLGTEVTSSEIADALRLHCSDWIETDRETLIAFTAELAKLIGDIGFGSFTPFNQTLAYPIHCYFVGEMLERGGETTPECMELRRDSFMDRHVLYPLVGYPMHESSPTRA